MKRKTVLAIIGLCLLGLCVWALALNLRPLAFDWSGDSVARGKRVGLHVTRVVLERWSYTDSSDANAEDILLHARMSHNPDDFFLYVEYSLEVDGNALSDLPEGTIEGTGPMYVRYAGRELEAVYSTPGSVVVGWSVGDGEGEGQLETPMKATMRFGWDKRLEVSQTVTLKDGYKETLAIQLGLKELLSPAPVQRKVL